MDSVTQLVLGAAVGEAALGRKIGNRALLWGAAMGTFPDLDVFIPLGDVVSDFTYHRSASHSLFVLALATPLFAWLATRIHADTRESFKRWMLAIYLIFVTHVLLDSLTAYGTQIFWPISDTPVSLATVFIIDPFYTLPLVIGVVAALVMTRDSPRGHRINQLGLIASTAYLAWTLVAKVIVDNRFEDELERQGIAYEKLFTTPGPFNSLLWRAVVRDRDGYYEAYYSVFDGGGEIRFHRYASQDGLLDSLAGDWSVERLRWFSRGFYSVTLAGQDVVISDLRMGVEPNYVFRFKVAELSNPHPKAVEVVEQLQLERDFDVLPLVWARIWDPQVGLSYAVR
jgi:inner membrane protein